MTTEERRTRAAPRKAKKDPEEAPLFLQKTFQMVDTSPQQIVSWTDKGDTFVVKNLEEFCNLLPSFFKHRNFRSFVRQLNFYGFRKLRADSVPVRRPEGWWEFKHEKFLKGRADLLIQIKRAEHYAEEEKAKNAIKNAIETKVEESDPLHGRIEQMTSTIEQLTSLVDALLLERSTGIVNSEIPVGITSAAEALTKKRKMFSTPSAPAKPFGDEIQQPELEVDEAHLLSQMSLDSPFTPLPLQPSMGGVGSMCLESSMSNGDMDRPLELDRSFSGFDFSDPNDVGLKPDVSLARSASSSSMGNDIFQHPYVMDFFTKMANEHSAAEVPQEPHVAENTNNILRTPSSTIRITV